MATKTAARGIAIPKKTPAAKVPPKKVNGMEPGERITAWSFSRWRDYSKCPFYARCKYVLKLKEPEHPAMSRGGQVHDIAARSVFERPTAKLAEELRQFKPSFVALRKEKPGNVRVENELAFDASWKPCGWMDPQVWCRVKIDLTVVNGERRRVVDHKTGQVREHSDKDQLDLYALGTFASEREVEYVSVELWYLDHGKVLPDPVPTYSRSDLPALKRSWNSNVRAMMNDRRFDPRPGSHCGRCHFRRSNGGPCKY
jgi:CRISPR/Cas system-associated exonuclease Cas4 (RecB family)